MSDYTYPAEFIKKAQTRIQKQVEGNGIDPKTIKLDVKRQGLDEFSAQTNFSLDIDVTTTQIKGKKSVGERVDAGKTQSTIQSYIADLQSKDSFNTDIKEKIKSMPNKGFGVDNQVVPLSQFKKQYCEQHACGTCQGKGQSTCNACRGQGRTQCTFCYTTGMIPCLHCNGRGEIQHGETRQICATCQGRREVFCTQCHGQKMVQCQTCQARGVTSCGQCNGEGANSVHTTVTPIAKINGVINLQELPDEPKIFANKIGGIVLAKGGHIDVENISPPIDKIEKQKPSELSFYQNEDDINMDEIDRTVFYTAKMPWAVAGIEVKNKPYNIAFVGKKGAICDAGHFMDDMLDHPITLMRDAAIGNGFVAGLLKEACEFRVSRETLSAVAKTNRKKAMMHIHKNYGIGLTKLALQNFVQNAYLALKRVTRRPRYIGLMIGLIISAGVQYFWFMNGGRAMSETNPVNIRYMMDAIPLVVGIIVTLISIKGAGFIVFKRLMRDIGVNTNKMPPLGKAGLYALFGNLTLWGLAMAQLLLVH